MGLEKVATHTKQTFIIVDIVLEHSHFSSQAHAYRR